MQHYLSSFENSIDSTIVERGKEYHKQGLVQEFEEREESVFTALVQGTEVYETKIVLDGEEIADHLCDCPYDMGEFCKHETALLFAVRNFLQMGEAEPTNNEKKRKKSPQRKKRKTVMDKLSEGLKKLSSEEVLLNVLEYASQDRYFRDFMLRRCPIEEKDSKNLKKIYIDQIQKCIRSAADRHGFVGYWECQYAVKAANELLESVPLLLQRKDFSIVFAILQAEIETLYSALGEVDDSSGEFGDAIETTWHYFRQLCENVPKDHSLKKEMFAYFLSEMPKKKYSGWYAWKDFSGMAAELVVDDEEEKQLINALDSVVAEKEKEPKNQYTSIRNGQVYKGEFGGMSDYEMQNIIAVKRKILEKRGKQQESLALREEYLYIPDFRLEKIEELYRDSDFSKAKKLAEEGIRIAEEKGHPGTVEYFEKWLLKIAEKEKDLHTLRKYWRAFFVRNSDWDSYRKLKKSYSSEEWKKEFDSLCTEKANSRWGSDVLLQMYEKEEMWNKMESLLEKIISDSLKNSWGSENALRILDSWERVVKEHFPKRLLPWYQDILRCYVAYNMGRNHYKKVCAVLRHIRKHLHGQELVEELKQEFIKNYKARRALLEELRKV